MKKVEQVGYFAHACLCANARVFYHGDVIFWLGNEVLIDDSVDCRMILRMALEREGCRCIEAADGIAALKVFQEKPIDFIITDFQMPHMDGCEFLEVISSATVSCPPAVMVTGNFTDSVRMRATHAGALAVLSKPFDQRKILQMVQEVVHRKQEAHH